MSDSDNIHTKVQVAVGVFSILGGAFLLSGWFYWATYISMFGLSGLDLSPSVHALMFMGLRVVLKVIVGVLVLYFLTRLLWFFQGSKGRKTISKILASPGYWIIVCFIAVIFGIVGSARRDVTRDISVDSRLSNISITPGAENPKLSWPSELIAQNHGDLPAGGARDLRVLFIRQDRIFLVPVATGRGNEVGAVPRVLAMPIPKFFVVESGKKKIGWDLLW